MKEFLNNSTLVFKNIHKLKEMTGKMEKYILLKQNSVMDDAKEEALENQIDRLDSDFDTVSESIKEEIKRSQEETNKLAKNGMDQREIGMRNTHIFKHSRDLTEAITQYRNIKCEYKNKEKEMLKKAYQIVNPKVSDSDLEKLSEDKDFDSSMGTAFSLGSKSAQQIMIQAKNRKQKLEKIVEVINKLVSLIEEIDALVKSNTKVVDDIVVHMTEAEVNTAEANKQLESALLYQRRVNFFKKVFLVIVLVFIGLVLLWIVIRFGANRNSGTYFRSQN